MFCLGFVVALLLIFLAVLGTTIITELTRPKSRFEDEYEDE